MPSAAPKPCRQAGCSALVAQSGFCEAHRKHRQAQQDKQRGNAHQRGYGYKWQQASKGYLRAHPLCECPECQAGDKQVTIATVVDHIKPHRGDMALFWDRNNWQAMSKEHHDKKTAREDGAFGRPTSTSTSTAP